MVFTDNDRALAHFLALNGVVLFGAWRAAARNCDDFFQAVFDTILLWLGTQYVVVGLCGVFGFLTPAAISMGGIICGGGLAWLGRAGRSSAIRARQTVGRWDLRRLWKERPWQTVIRQRPAVSRWDHDSITALVIALFVAGYLAAYACSLSFLPPTATDALAYHLPVAVQWLQDRRIDLWPGWHWNPANSFSPVAVTTFLFWMIAPSGNDVFARHVQLLPAMMIFLAVMQLCRSAGARSSLGALAGAALVLSRPILSQAMLVKDDLVMAGLFGAAVAALQPAALRDRGGAIRLGLSIGLLAATKYPALVVLPILLLAIDAPWRAGWRGGRYGLATLVAAMLVAPWLVRNAVLTGNPIYPLEIRALGRTILPGLFTVQHDPALRRIAGVWHMLTAGYHAINPWLIVPLLALSGVPVVRAPRRLIRSPALRLAALGAPLGLGAFVLLSPHPEVRYFFSSLIPLFSGAMIGIVLLSIPTWIGYVIAGSIAAGSIFSGFESTASVAQFAGTGLIVGVIGAALAWWADRPARRWVIAGTAAVFLSLIAYVHFSAYVNLYRDATDVVWDEIYGDEAGLWRYVRHQTPADATIGYTGTYLTYPLYGFDLTRRVTYVPTRSGVEKFLDLPFLGSEIPGYQLVDAVTAAMRENPDRVAWARRLSEQGITHLLIVRTRLPGTPIEWAWARQSPSQFHLLHQTPAGALFRRIAP